MASTNSTPKKRRGFGLFDSEDEYDTDFVESQKEPVQFSGDMSGFASMSDSEGPSRSATKSSSRTSSLTTPKRRSAVANRRSTPYSSTTSRALMRAKRESKESSENEEERLISESMFGPSPVSNKNQKARFVMSGALGYSEDEQPSTEAETDPESYRTPNRELFSRKPKTSRQQLVETNQHPEGSKIVKKTWGQWLRSILPDVVTKPVESIMHTSHPEELEMSPATPFKTPEQYRDGALPIPGSFEKAVALPPKDDNYINPNFLNHDTQRTPIRGSEGLFQFNKESPFSVGSPVSTQSNASQSPASAKKGSRAPTAPTSAKRMIPPPPPVSYRKPSNFIERMRNAKKQKRYDPYSRPSATPRKVAGSFAAQPFEEMTKDLTPEEELELLERREKDRKVQEAEDRYLRRETLRRLGRSVEDEEMSDTPNVSSKKGKGKEATVEDSPEMEDGMEGDRSGSTTPPNSPPRQSSGSSLFSKPAGAPLFQFQNIAPKPAPTVEKKAPAESAPIDKPVFSFTSTNSFGEPDNDKENISQPPPPPVMSHRELPSPPVPAPTPPSLNGGLFAEKQPIGGFGISDAPIVQHAPLVSPMSRQRFDKFKPRVSSGLRESATIEKENEHDKENPSENTNNGEGSSSSAKPGKAAFGTQVVPKPASQVSSSGALREVGRNSPVGTGVKVDVRAKIAALPVKDLSPIASWPISLEVLSAGVDMKVQEYVKTAFAASSQEQWLQDWANEIFGAAREKVQRL
ncbi:hypothetical protein BDD12DRAFT_878974 [Trichophaea hybrida]|nr:hypothetical protein BDD12DRAFT_878974 [Trichophaea hybrida]